MVYYKLILDDRRFREDETYPVIVRVIYNRKNSSIATGIRVNKSQWNASTHEVERTNSNYKDLNLALSEFFLKVQKAIHQLETEQAFSFDALKERLTIGHKAPKVTSGCARLYSPLIPPQFLTRSLLVFGFLCPTDAALLPLRNRKSYNPSFSHTKTWP